MIDATIAEGFIKNLKCFTEGNIIVRTNDLKSLQIHIEKIRKTLDIHEMPFEGFNGGNIFTKIARARDFGKLLKKNDQTVVLCYNGKPVMRFGKEANPKLSLLATFSRNVEITNLSELRRLGKNLK